MATFSLSSFAPPLSSPPCTPSPACAPPFPAIHSCFSAPRSSSFSAFSNAGFSSQLPDTLLDNIPPLPQLKQQLIDTLHFTDRGFNASDEIRSEIAELISQLESRNPTSAPTEALDTLDGKWILVYSSYSGFFPFLAAGTLPLVKVGEISQTIDSNQFTLVNTVTFTGPLAKTSLSTNASFEICSPKRLQIKLEEGVIDAPQFIESLEIPENIDFLGQKFDLAAFQGPFQSLQTAVYSITRVISGQPPLKFPLRADSSQAWLVMTYLDEDLRISRGDSGIVFVSVKEASPLFD